MANSTVTIGILVEDQDSISFTDLCEQHAISEQALLEMLEHGLIPSINIVNTKLQFDRLMFSRINKAYRLQKDLELNPAGVVLALELMDKLTELHHELGILKKHLDIASS